MPAKPPHPLSVSLGVRLPYRPVVMMIRLK
jgi:hypothetical protein